MPQFVYTAKDRSGQLTQGELEAASPAEAAAQLRERGLWATQIRPGRRARPRPPARRGVSLRDLALFYRQLTSMQRAGIGLHQALETLGRETPNPRLRRVIGELAAGALEGQSLGAQLERYPWLFTELQRGLVQAAEQGGFLEEAFRQLAEYLEREWTLRSRIRQRLFYPFLVVLALIFIPALPALVLEGPLAYLAAVAARWLPLGLAFGALAALGWLCLRHPGGRFAWGRLLLSLPVLGKVLRKLAIARFARAMALLAAAGVSAGTALRTAAAAAGNAPLERAVLPRAAAVERGGSLGEALTQSRFFPPIFLSMVQTGEESGEVDSLFARGAEYYEQEAEHALAQLTVVLGVLALLLVAAAVLVELARFYGSYLPGGLM